MIPQPVSPATFHCTICEEPSLRICVFCTKDTCDNHICEKCLRCSDCCTCEVPLDSDLNGHAASVASVVEPLVVEEGEMVVAVETVAEPEAIAEAVPDPVPAPEPEPEAEPPQKPPAEPDPTA